MPECQDGDRSDLETLCIWVGDDVTLIWRLDMVAMADIRRNGVLR